MPTGAHRHPPPPPPPPRRRWFTSRGMPPCDNTYDTSLAQAAFDLATRWHTCDVMGIGGGHPGPAAGSP
jgi:leukotriene-A4 hydrolase